MILIFLVFGLIFYKDFLPLVKNKDKKGMTAFLLIFIAGLTYAILMVFDVQIENPAKALWMFMRKIGMTFPS